ncbi:MAG: ABC transporter permease subunit [Actinomycetia bacterium]|nr:ABC transporter permease subunit [Actinomycetes bacterium]
MTSEVANDVLVREQLDRRRAARPDRRETFKGGARQVIVFAVFAVTLALAYDLYKIIGQSIDDRQHDWPIVGSVLPRTDDLNMPPLGSILGAFGETPGGTASSLGRQLVGEAAFTLREAAAGFAVGVVIGLGIAIGLARWRRLEQGLLPYVIASQTIPIIAIAPIVIIWSRKNTDFLPWEWQDWMSVSIIAAFLTFFPVAVNGLRGLQAPRAEDLELMVSYAASWGQTLWRLRLPASVPYLFAAFKIAATASIVGAIVGEISGGVSGGLGRRILSAAFNYSSGPERLYAAVIGSALLGILVFLSIVGLERLILGRQGREAVS